MSSLDYDNSFIMLTMPASMVQNVYCSFKALCLNELQALGLREPALFTGEMFWMLPALLGDINEGRRFCSAFSAASSVFLPLISRDGNQTPIA